MLGAEITHLQQQLRARFANSGGGPVIELTTALETALWQKNVPLELSPDGQLAYRLARSNNRTWRIGPTQAPAYQRILDQLPATITIRPGSTPPAVLVRESVGALREHHIKHAAGNRHHDQVITLATTAARLEQVRMPVTLTDTTTELLHLLHDTAPDDTILTTITHRLRPPGGTPRTAGGR